MDIVISFFRDVLDGPLYIAIVVIGVILICAGIGYFAEKSQIARKKKKDFDAVHVTISDPTTQNIQSMNNATTSNTVSAQNIPVSTNVVNSNVGVSGVSSAVNNVYGVQNVNAVSSAQAVPSVNNVINSQNVPVQNNVINNQTIPSANSVNQNQ